jgi:hypothetical protein
MYLFKGRDDKPDSLPYVRTSTNSRGIASKQYRRSFDMLATIRSANLSKGIMRLGRGGAISKGYPLGVSHLIRMPAYYNSMT